jgi:UDP-N-acetylenolpyruvoylglucosamine reductase
MIRTTNTDANGLPAVLKTYGRLTQDEEDDLVRAGAATVFSELGVTTTDTTVECYEVLERIPDELLISTIQVGSGWVLLHARIEGL